MLDERAAHSNRYILRDASVRKVAGEELLIRKDSSAVENLVEAALITRDQRDIPTTNQSEKLGLTSKMSHDGSWRGACASTIRDSSRPWLWRLVRLLAQ